MLQDTGREHLHLHGYVGLGLVYPVQLSIGKAIIPLRVQKRVILVEIQLQRDYIVMRCGTS